jgi:hypothetical protein
MGRFLSASLKDKPHNPSSDHTETDPNLSLSSTTARNYNNPFPLTCSFTPLKNFSILSLPNRLRNTTSVASSGVASPIPKPTKTKDVRIILCSWGKGKGGREDGSGDF